MIDLSGKQRPSDWGQGRTTPRKEAEDEEQNGDGVRSDRARGKRAGKHRGRTAAAFGPEGRPHSVLVTTRRGQPMNYDIESKLDQKAIAGIEETELETIADALRVRSDLKAGLIPCI